MKTVYHAYNFNLDEPEQAKAYKALCRRLRAEGCRRLKALGDYYDKDADGVQITLETEHLFDNQWNANVAGRGVRVFDWAEGVYPNQRIRRGHYLDQTPEMREIRDNTHKCGYCGKQEPAAKGYAFCPHCIDSEYLKPGDLPLTRMAPVSESGPGQKFAPLTEAESAHLMPLYKEAQIHGATERGKARIAKARARVEEKFRKATGAAKVERDGFIWLMDRGYDPSNVIYYSHTDRFCFGWRTPLSGDVLDATLEMISEFPFRYQIKTPEKTLEDA